MKYVGRILVHGFILTGYLPLNINHAVLFKILTVKTPSANFITKCYLDCLNDADRLLIERALTSENFDMAITVQLVELFSSCHICSVPTPDLFPETLNNICKFITLVSPYYFILCMQISDHLLSYVTESFFETYLSSLRPSGEDIDIMARQSDDPSLFGLEERVYRYVECYVRALSVQQASMFMKYISGAEILQPLVFVSFNGVTASEMMIPVDHTCSIELEVSRFSMSFEQFKLCLDGVLNNSNAWNHFDII